MGVGISDITIGGFSMGGHVALHSVYRKQLEHMGTVIPLCPTNGHKFAKRS